MIGTFCYYDFNFGFILQGTVRVLGNTLVCFLAELDGKMDTHVCLLNFTNFFTLDEQLVFVLS